MAEGPAFPRPHDDAGIARRPEGRFYLFGEEGVAFAVREHQFRERGGWLAAQEVRRAPANLCRVQPSQGEVEQYTLPAQLGDGPRCGPAVQRLLPYSEQQQHRRIPQPAGEMDEDIPGRRFGPLQVVQRHHQRTVRGQRGTSDGNGIEQAQALGCG